MAGPWEKYKAQAPTAGGVITLPPDPRAAATDAREEIRLRIAQAEEARRAAEYNATHNPDGSPKDPAAQVGIPPEQMHVTGADFLKMLSPSDAAQVKALAEGRMAFPAGKAAASPYWQQRLAQVSQYDPEFDAINYNARAATRRDFTAGKSSANIKALNTAIGHLGELYGQIDGTASHQGFPGATMVNAIQNAISQSYGSPGPTKYQQTAGALAGELTQVYRQSGGAEADIQRYLSELSPNASLDQKREAIKNMANLLRSRLDAINDQYTKGMGTSAQPLQVLDPHAQQVLGVINSGGTLPPAGSPPAGNPGGTNPGGNPPDAGPTLGLSRGASFTTPQDLAVAAAVNKAFRAGGDIQALTKAAQDAGGQITPQDLGNFQQAILARKAGRAVQFSPQATGHRTPVEQAIGSALMSPVGTTMATGISGAGLNMLDGILPDQMKALRTLNPNAATIGDIGGAIAGTGAINAGARMGLKALPAVGESLMQGGKAASLARGLAADTAYGAAYGQNVNNDAVGGAIGGALSSAGGQVIGKGIGRAIGGFTQSEAGKALSQLIPDMTIGQRIGGPVKAIEDAMTSIPGVSEMIARRRTGSIEGLNRAAFNQASGGTVNQIGREGLDQFGNVTEGAYRQALDGKQFPLDQQFAPEYQQALGARSSLVPDYQIKFDTAINNRVSPIVDNGAMTGEQYQQAMRGLRDYKGARGADGFENDYSNAISGIQDTLRQNVLRSASPETVSQLGQADRLYRGQKILEDAINRNRKDAAGIGSDMFRPSDLTEAVYQNGKKFGGEAPLVDLARYAQEALPNKVPDSGTAKRLFLGSLLGVGTGGLGASLSDDRISGAQEGAGAGLGLIGLLALGGTKTGQAAIAKALFNRPDSLAQIGGAVVKRKGLFGTASVPLLLEGQDQ